MNNKDLRAWLEECKKNHLPYLMNPNNPVADGIRIGRGEMAIEVLSRLESDPEPGGTEREKVCECEWIWHEYFMKWETCRGYIPYPTKQSRPDTCPFCGGRIKEVE